MLTVNSPSVDLYRQLLATRGHAQLIQDASYIFIYRSPDEIDLTDLNWRTRIQRGAEIVQLDRQELEALEPDISPRYKAAVEIRQQGENRESGPGWEKPWRNVSWTREDASAAVRSTHCARPLMAARALRPTWVNCKPRNWSFVQVPGPLSSHAKLGCDIPLVADRGYHLNIENPGVRINNTVSVAQYHFALSSMETGLRCAGTSELGGVHAGAQLSPRPDVGQARETGVAGVEHWPHQRVDGTPARGSGQCADDLTPAGS